MSVLLTSLSLLFVVSLFSVEQVTGRPGRDKKICIGKCKNPAKELWCKAKGDKHAAWREVCRWEGFIPNPRVGYVKGPCVGCGAIPGNEGK